MGTLKVGQRSDFSRCTKLFPLFLTVLLSHCNGAVTPTGLVSGLACLSVQSPIIQWRIIIIIRQKTGTVCFN